MGNFAEPMAGVDGVKDYRFLIKFFGRSGDTSWANGGEAHVASVDIPSVNINENRYQEGNNAYPAKIPGSFEFGDMNITKAVFKNNTKMTQRFCQQLLTLQGINKLDKSFKFDLDVYVLDDATDTYIMTHSMKGCWFKSLGYGGLNATSSGQLIMKSFTLAVEYMNIGGNEDGVSRAQGTA